jgi:hypothetical protein
MGNLVSFIKKKLKIEYEYSIIENPKIKIVCKYNYNCKCYNQFKGKSNHYIIYDYD